MGRWAEANRMPTAGDLHWGGRVRGLAARVTQPGCPVGHPEAALPPRGRVLGLLRSGPRPPLQGASPQRDMTSRKTWPPGDITSKASWVVPQTQTTFCILHFDKMIL